MRSLTVHVDDRPVRGRQKTPPRRTSLRLNKMRWPGILRSRTIRRAVLAGVGMLVLLLAVLLFPGQRVTRQLIAWSGQAEIGRAHV